MGMRRLRLRVQRKTSGKKLGYRAFPTLHLVFLHQRGYRSMSLLDGHVINMRARTPRLLRLLQSLLSTRFIFW